MGRPFRSGRADPLLREPVAALRRAGPSTGFVLLASILLGIGAATGATIDSLRALPDWNPRDPEVGLRLTPHALALDPVGRLWLLDRSRMRVMRLAPDGNGRSFAVGELGGVATTPVADLAISGTFVFLLEPASPSISLLDLDGYYRERVDLGPELSTAGYSGFLASRLIVGGTGDLWLLEPRGGRLLRLDRLGRFLDAPLDAMAGSERPQRIADAALAPDDGVLLLDAGRAGIQPLTVTGAPLAFEPLAPPVVEPASLSVDPFGLRFVLEGNGRIRVLEPGGTLAWDGRVPGGDLAAPHRSCVTRDSVLCSADPSTGAIHRWRILYGRPEDAHH